MNRVTHFEFAVDDMERAKAFYQKVFGWKIEVWHGPFDYVMLTTGEGERGIDGALIPREAQTPPTTVTLDVQSVDKAVADVIAGGGSVAVPKMAIPGVGYLAYCTDTEGNLFGLMEMDENAGAG